MRRKLNWLLIVLLSFCAQQLKAQEGEHTALVKGRLLNKLTLQPANDVQVTIPYLKLLAVTDGEGNFIFSRVPYGNHTVVVGGTMVVPDTFRILVNEKVVDLKDFNVTPNENAAAQTANQIPTIALEENNLSGEDDGVKTSNVSGLLTASRDPFQNTAAFTFGQYRFQPRGYERNQQEVQINGAPMNDVETNDAYWSQWGGLNDVFRSRSNTYGLQPSEYAFGGLNGTTYFDATAANQRKQTKITYSLSNRSYRNRLMLTHSSGLLKGGWSYSASVSKRWAKEGYVDGTFYDGYSYYAAVSKKIGTKHELNLAAFGAPTRRGKTAPATKEAYDLAGTHFYNPNWGYQNGEKRNAKVADNFQPAFILNYEYTPNEKLRWNTAVGYQFGKNKNSAIDWYNAQDPRPDYYRYLPSYYTLNELDPANAPFTRAQNQQINWDLLVNRNLANYETRTDGTTGETINGRRSVYVVSNDVDDIKKFTFNTNLQYALNDHITLHGGVTFLSQRTESYKQLVDLLGGDYFLNLNQFAVQQNVPNVNFNQYDLDHPNRLIREGDKYNYDYISRFNKSRVWAQSVFTFNKADFFIAANAGTNSFSREGLYRNGLFADISKGKSEVQNFVTYGVKGGVTYKLNGRNYLFVNASYGTDAPTFDNTFISSRTRNITVDNPEVQRMASIEGGYLMRSPKYNIRAVGYVTDVTDGAEVKRFYNDDPAYQTFVNYVMQNVNTRFIGTELAAEVKIIPQLSVIGVAALGQAFYTDNPNVSVYRDNDTMRTARVREVYVKNMYVAAGPQSAYSLGFKYFSKDHWIANLNFNYFDRNYVDVNPDRRTGEAADLINQNSELYAKIFNQEKLPSAFTVDVSASYSLLISKYSRKIPRNTYLLFSAGVSNLLDNQDVVTGGFEQLRYDFTDNNPGKFPSKYFYGLGRNFFINVSLRF